MSSTRSAKHRSVSELQRCTRPAFACALLFSGSFLVGQSTTPPPGSPEPSGEPVVLEEFVVSGVRASLITAQETKRNALVLIDSIAAQDIGKFPDNSVADALQRVPGIQVGRGEGEVSTVVIRGLPNLGTTLNGHEIFTGTGRGVALGDIPAELVAGLDVYKTSAPEHIEGGIAGVIDIRLRRPLDFEDRQIAASGRAIYGEDAEKWSWVGTALLSDRWNTPGGGDVGALYSASYSRSNYLDQVSFNYLFEPVPSGGVISDPQIQLPLTQGSLIIPGERRRFAHNVSLQFRPSQELEFYGDFLYTAYRNKRNIHFLIGFPRFGTLQSAEVYPGTNVPSRLVSTNNFHLTSTQAFSDRTDSYQGVFGTKWQRGAVKASTELVYNWSSFKPRVLIVDTQFRPTDPGTFTFNFNNDGRAEMSVTGADLADPNSYYLWGLFDNHGYETSEQIGWRGDGEYVFNDGFFKNLKAGLRYTTREAKDRQTSVDDIAPVGGRGVVPTSSITGFGSLNPTGTFNTYPTRHWYGADPGFLYNNVAQVRQLFGRPAEDPNFNPAIAFTDEEKTYAAYLQAGYNIEIAGRPLDGLFGVRVVKTEQDLTGYRSDGTPLNQDKDETDVLPMFNARLALQDDLYLRFAAGRSVTRPNFADLNPIINLNAPTTTGARGTGSGGNPDLDTVKSNQVDVSLEYYFTRSSYASVTGFYREIKGYVETFAELETINGVDYTITRPRNTGKGELKGVELTYQHFPEFLPDALKGFGLQTNFTYMKGDTDAQDPANPSTPGARVRQPYAQVARRAYNVVGIYERAGFSARLAYNWRGEYTDTFNGPNAAGSPLRQIIVKPRGQLDFSASYAINDQLTLTLDATNILDNKYQDYFYDPQLYPRDTRSYDRTIAIGARFRY
jgi:iron complex outermembrane recepter protein